MKTFFIPNYLNQTIKNNLLIQKNTEVLFNIEFMPFEAWVRNKVKGKHSTLVTQLSFFKKLCSHKEDFPLYGNLFQYPAFSSEILSFTKECLLNSVDLSSLPESTDSEKELKRCILFCATLDHPETAIASLSFDQTLFNQTTSFTKTFSSPFFYHLHELAIQSGLHTMNFEPAKEITYRHALNPRQEVEGIAQEIIKDNVLSSDVNIVVSDESYLPLIDSVFSHYQIPVSFVSRKVLSPFTQQFISGVNLCIHKNHEHLLEAITHHLFSASIPQLAQEYIDRCLENIDQWINFTPQFDQLEEGILLNSYDITYLNKIEKSFISFREEILTELIALLEIDNPQQCLLTIFEYCAKTAAKQNKTRELYNLKKKLDEVFNELDSFDDCLTLCAFLENIYRTEDINVDDILVSDYTHPLLPRKRSYILGAHQKNYPNFNARSGLFDEHYVEKINYPSLQERFSLHTQQLSWLITSGEICHFTYPSMDYQGKEFTPSVELDDLSTHKGKLSCTLVDYKEKTNHKLNPLLASTLFFNQGRLEGSVSSFELYFNCPYSYFLKRGLRLKDAPQKTLQSNTIGTLQHALLEKVYKEDLLQSDNLDKILESSTQSYFAILQTIYPKERLLLKVAQKRLLISLTQSLYLLKEMSEPSSFVPSHFEYQFKKELENHPITLIGVIDRIDTYNDFLRIIDYKSSQRTLNEKKLKAGVQLQLLTYLTIATEELNRKPLGAYYFSTNQETISIDPIDVKKEEIIDSFPILSNEKLLKEHRYKGWTIENSDAFTDKEFFTTSNYDMDAIEQVLTALFDKLVDQLKQGRIELTPLENACTYCNFKAICRFKGLAEKEKPLVCHELPLKKGKDE